MLRVNEEGSVDFGFTFREENRFRVSVYRQKGFLGVGVSNGSVKKRLTSRLKSSVWSLKVAWPEFGTPLTRPRFARPPSPQRGEGKLWHDLAMSSPRPSGERVDRRSRAG